MREACYSNLGFTPSVLSKQDLRCVHCWEPDIMKARQHMIPFRTYPFYEVALTVTHQEKLESPMGPLTDGLRRHLSRVEYLLQSLESGFGG